LSTYRNGFDGETAAFDDAFDETVNMKIGNCLEIAARSTAGRSVLASDVR
jgi:hypothetical protein